MRKTLGATNLLISPLCLGGNVFGWTADAAESSAVLDAYSAAGGNFIDTADMYSAWVPGHTGGESERIIGEWMRQRGNRADVIVATKVGKLEGHKGLSPANIRTQCEASLKSLQTDYIDVYYAHEDDEATPLVDTLAAFDALIREGKVRYIAASNYTAPRLAAALEVSAMNGLAHYVALQPHYNLLHRAEYEGDLREVCASAGVACLPYFGLARGFLTGKYRHGVDVSSARAGGVGAYENDRGWHTLEVLDDIAATNRTTVAAVALAWLAAQPTVAAPIASARTIDQLAELLPMNELRLTTDELSDVATAAADVVA